MRLDAGSAVTLASRSLADRADRAQAQAYREATRYLGGLVEQ